MRASGMFLGLFYSLVIGVLLFDPVPPEGSSSLSEKPEIITSGLSNIDSISAKSFICPLI